MPNTGRTDRGRRATAIALCLGLCGCAGASSTLVRTGDEPRYEDDDVAFRTIYYFRVFDVCEGARPGFASAQDRAKVGGRVDYDQLFKAPSGPPRLLTDSLYRFRMTGKASTLGSKIHFESGTLRKEQIDPFGANVVYDKANGRFYFKSQEDTQADARQTEALERVRALRQTRAELAGMDSKDPALRDQLAMVDQLIVENLARLSSRGLPGAAGGGRGREVTPETVEKAATIAASVGDALKAFEDQGAVASGLASGTYAAAGIAINGLLESAKAEFKFAAGEIAAANKDEKVGGAFITATAAVKAVAGKFALSDLGMAENLLSRRSADRSVRTEAFAALAKTTALPNPQLNDLDRARREAHAVEAIANVDAEAVREAMVYATRALDGRKDAEATEVRRATDAIDTLTVAVTPWDVAAKRMAKAADAYRIATAVVATKDAAQTEIDKLQPAFDKIFAKNGAALPLSASKAATAELVTEAKNGNWYASQARAASSAPNPSPALPLPAGYTSFAIAAQAWPAVVVEKARDASTKLVGAATAVDGLTAAAIAALQAIEKIGPLLPADASRETRAAVDNARAALSRVAGGAETAAKLLRAQALAAADLPLAAPIQAARSDAAAICEDGNAARRGFQVLGPEGWRTFDQSERLLMAMSTSAKPLISTLNEISGRILNTGVSPAEALLPLMQERMRATEAKYRGERVAASAKADDALQTIIDAFRAATDAQKGSLP